MDKKLGELSKKVGVCLWEEGRGQGGVSGGRMGGRERQWARGLGAGTTRWGSSQRRWVEEWTGVGGIGEAGGHGGAGGVRAGRGKSGSGAGGMEAGREGARVPLVTSAEYRSLTFKVGQECGGG